MDIFKGLNDKQTEAVKAVEGPCLVIAGAGSGKTKTLTHRIAYLIQEKNVNPKNILAVTFTNKAAAEMKNRVKLLLQDQDGKSYLPIIGTFHSVCMRILRSEAKNIGLPPGFLIYDANDQTALIKESLKEINISAQQFNPNSILTSISSAKNNLNTPDKLIEKAGGYFEEIVAKCYLSYQDKLQKAGALDFDDLIMNVVKSFKNNFEILEKYQRIFKFILVDEYQDTNHLQYQLTNMLAKKHQNICVVGDDWQSIYKWRGADIANILEFEKDYPQAKIILLEQNYRSCQNILDASYGIISKNKNKKDKKLWSAKDKGNPIVVVEVEDEREEGNFIVKKIKELAKQAIVETQNVASLQMAPLQYKDFAVLYRTNAQSRAIEESFLMAGIPYKIVGGLKFYARKEIKDILAYLRLTLNPRDKISIERIINVPMRGIGQVSVGKLLNFIDASGGIDIESAINIENMNKSKQDAINSFFKLISACQNKTKEYSLTKLIDFVIVASGYDKYIQAQETGEARWENIQELFTAASKFDHLPCEEALRMFLEEVALIADTDEIESSGNVVNLMTFHSSKGLEFNTIFMAGIEEGILPHSRSTSNNSSGAELEEERRLCYVGMTRAKERLFILFAKMRHIYGSTVLETPSRFINEIPEHLKEYIFNDGFEGDDLETIIV